jgi:hypothetical protein
MAADQGKIVYPDPRHSPASMPCKAAAPSAADAWIFADRCVAAVPDID